MGWRLIGGGGGGGREVWGCHDEGLIVSIYAVSLRSTLPLQEERQLMFSDPCGGGGGGGPDALLTARSGVRGETCQRCLLSISSQGFTSLGPQARGKIIRPNRRGNSEEGMESSFKGLLELNWGRYC